MVNKKEYKVLVSEEESGGEEEVDVRSHPLSNRSPPDSDSDLEDSGEDRRLLPGDSDLEDSGEDRRLLPGGISAENSPDTGRRSRPASKSPDRGGLNRQEADTLLGGASFTANEPDFEHNTFLGVSNHPCFFRQLLLIL